MIARKLGELFGFNRGLPPFYAACRFNELSRGSVSCLNSLTANGVHDRQLFDKLLWCLVSSPIFVSCQRLMPRKIAELFNSNRAMSQFYEAGGIDDVSRGSVMCLYAASFGGAVFTATTLVVCAETDDPGGCRGDTV